MSVELIDALAWMLFGATLVERLMELIVSKRNAAWSFSQGGAEYGEGHYKWMVVMHSLFLVAMTAEYAWMGSVIDVSVRMGAMAVAVLCQVLRWWVITTLGHQWNTRVIIVPGLKRVTNGPYRFLSHPNYVVVAIETFTLPLIFGSWRTALVFSILNALMMRVRIRVENQALLSLKTS